jgi:hypothetical protein
LPWFNALSFIGAGFCITANLGEYQIEHKIWCYAILSQSIASFSAARASMVRTFEFEPCPYLARLPLLKCLRVMERFCRAKSMH